MVYVCPQGEDLRRHTLVRSDRVVKYRGAAAVCNSFILKSQCTNSLNGRGVSRAFEEDYLDRVRAYHKTELYQISMIKRRVWNCFPSPNKGSTHTRRFLIDFW